MYDYVYNVILLHLCRYDGALSEMQVDFVHWSLKFDLFSSAYQWVTLFVTNKYQCCMRLVVKELLVSISKKGF